MEKSCGRREGINQTGCMWVFITIFGSNQKLLLMDKKRGSKRFAGNDEKKKLMCSCESSQESVQKLIEEDVDVSIAGDEHVVETKVCEENLREIMKRLIAQKEGEIQTCKDLLEAFHDVLGSEEESSLLKKKISHEDAQSLGDFNRVVVEEDKLEAVSKQEAVVVQKRKYKFFSRKWRSEERRNRSSQAVLKPNSLDVDSTGSKSKTGRTFSRFIIGLLRGRLQPTVRKKSCDVLADRNQNTCLQEEIQSKHVSDEEEEEELLCSEGRSEADKEDTIQTREDSKKTMSGLYVAAKKHLSEMLANGDIDVSLPDKEVPRILGKILSLPEFSSPGDSPRLIPPHDGLTDEDSDKDDETLFTINVSVPRDHAKETEKTELEPLSETSTSSIITECKEPATDVQGKSSPVSVLEPLLTDDERSPTTSTRFSSVQPLCIRFDEADSPEPDKDNNLKTSMDDKELILAYIKAVVNSSGLNWEELLTRPFYSEQLLEPELADDIVFSSTELCDDKSLLDDCINEVLVDFCENGLNPGPWVSFLKPELQLISDMEVAAKVAQEGVSWHLLPLPSPHTLDQMVKKDMAKTGSWMDLRFDIGWIGSSTSEMILDELVEEIIRSCGDNAGQEQQQPMI